MQIKLSYAEAQKLIIDVADKLTTPGEDVVVDVPDVWSIEPPTEPGDYRYWRNEWSTDIPAPIVWVQQEGNTWVAYSGDDGVNLTDLKADYWLGPLPVPELPVAEVTE